MTTPSPDRKPRCLRLVASRRGVNQCESERIPDSDFCLTHLERAVIDWCDRVASVAGQLGSDDAEALGDIIATLRRYAGAGPD